MAPRFAFLLLLPGLLCGCGSPALYQWGSYDQWLYDAYKHPEKGEDLYVDLGALIEHYERKPQEKPLAPGLYAEYGFLLMRRGETARAIEYYNKEKALWPESAAFMDSMIQTATRAGKSKASSASAGGAK